jgi:hypothetical protein
MNYQDMKSVCKDLTKLALNGSPYWRVGTTVSILILISTAFWGYANYATADDVDRKIVAATDSVQQQIASLTDDTKEIILELMESKIREAALVRCQLPPGSRNRENSEIDKLQRRYLKREGRLYVIPACDEL